MKKKFCILLLTMMIMLLVCQPLFASSSLPFDGEGTKESPYLIENDEDLIAFRDLVNRGESFENTHFLQTADIDLKKEPWVPIGEVDSGHCFYGVYDGGGYAVKNLWMGVDDEGLKIEKQEYTEEDDYGFFGDFGGTVVNLEIGSGKISGRNCGSFAVNSVGTKAAIINCCNKADLEGEIVGGIAVNFEHGVIASCWSSGKLTGNSTGGVLACGGELKMYYCYSTHSPLAPADVIQFSSFRFTEEEMNTADFASRMTKNAAFAQYLFANHQDAELKEWKLDENGNIGFSDSKTYINILGFVNWYALPLLLLIVLGVYGVKFSRVEKGQVYPVYGDRIRAAAVIFGILSFFLDTAVYHKGLSCLNPGNAGFIILVNGLFILSVWFIAKHHTFRFVWKREWIFLCILLAVVVVIELCQFDLVPRYDACLYYGSLVQAVDLFRLDLLTFLGAFACWKWIQGLALLIAPFEFLMPGEMIGVYLSNIIISVVTIICFYWLLRRCFVHISPLAAALGCAALIFAPYGIGLFTYLCMDWHTPFFLVWLICAYLKKNDLLISFCGFLLAFNKISGLAFYVFFLISMALIEVIRDKDKPVLQRLKDWWNWRKVILWVLPGVLFLVFYFHNYLFEIQDFYGADINATVSLKSKRGIANTLLQSYVYGFRWLFVILFLIAVVLLITKRRKISDVLRTEGIDIFVSVIVGSIAVLILLCLYNAIAECPRYTAMFNLFYAFSLVVCAAVIFSKEISGTILSGAVVLLLLVQTFWTIDPSILLTCDRVDTGKKPMYKLAMPGDIRPGMNLGGDYGPGISVMGDLYTYNLEYAFYDDLLDQALTDISPTEDDAFYSLDIIYYEWHLYGNHYNIYWNTRLQKRTYDGDDPDSIYFEDHRDITTAEICSLTPDDSELPDHFYLLVADRVDPKKAVAGLNKLGYEITYELHPENIYGKMSVYKFEK